MTGAEKFHPLALAIKLVANPPRWRWVLQLDVSLPLLRAAAGKEPSCPPPASPAS